jgi:hypothetical protein
MFGQLEFLKFFLILIPCLAIIITKQLIKTNLKIGTFLLIDILFLIKKIKTIDIKVIIYE